MTEKQRSAVCEPGADPAYEPGRWRKEVLEPATMAEDEIRAELRHDLDVYDRLSDPLSRDSMGHRITRLVEEMDRRGVKPNG